MNAQKYIKIFIFFLLKILFLRENEAGREDFIPEKGIRHPRGKICGKGHKGTQILARKRRRRGKEA